MEQINKNTDKKDIPKKLEGIAKTHQEKELLRAAIKQNKIEFIIIN